MLTKPKYINRNIENNIKTYTHFFFLLSITGNSAHSFCFKNNHTHICIYYITHYYHLFEVKIDARFEMMNKRPGITKSK